MINTISLLFRCDDENSDAYSEAPGFCDNVNNDCNEQIDEGIQGVYYFDCCDGYDVQSAGIFKCDRQIGYVTVNSDCNDYDSNIHSLHNGGTRKKAKKTIVMG